MIGATCHIFNPTAKTFNYTYKAIFVCNLILTQRLPLSQKQACQYIGKGSKREKIGFSIKYRVQNIP